MAAPLPLDRAMQLYLEHALDLSPRTRRNLRDRIALWKRLGCCDDCRAITTETFQEFRRAALARKLAPYTIETAVNAIKTLLRHVGPQQDGVPHGRALIERVPYSGRRLKVIVEPRPAATLDQISAVYRRAGQIAYPRHESMWADTWWRTFLVVAYNTGLRVSDLLYRLAWEHVRWDELAIVIAAGKTGKHHWLPINATLRAHLEPLRSAQGPVLPFAARQPTHLLAQLKTACAACGVGYFTPHAIRRRTGTEFERVHPGAGALLLGHSLQRGMTFGHYIAAETILRPAADKLPQPAAFLKQGG